MSLSGMIQLRIKLSGMTLGTNLSGMTQSGLALMKVEHCFEMLLEELSSKLDT